MSAIRQSTWKVLQFLLFSSIGAGILYWIFSGQQAAYSAQCALDGVPQSECSLLWKLWTDFRDTNWFWLGCTVLAFTISNISRALRWSMLIQELGYKPRIRNAFMAVMISYFTNLYLSRMGEVVRAGYMAKFEKINSGRVMGTVILDRLLDVLCMLAIIGLALLLQFNTIWTYLLSNAKLPGGSILTNPYFLVGLGTFVAIALGLFFLRDHFRHFAVYTKGRAFASSLMEGVKTVRHVERYWVFIFHTINIWFMYYVMTYCCFLAFAPTENLGLLAALTVFVFGSFGMVIPSPGGMGTYHALVIAALTIYGVGKIEAFSYANIMFFVVQIIYNVIVGGGAMLLMPMLNKNYVPLPARELAVPV